MRTGQHRVLWLPGVCLAMASGCLGSDMVDGTFTEEDWASLQTLRLDRPGQRPDCPAGLTSPCDAAIVLGRKLFAEPALSSSKTVACTTCHDPGHYFVDTRPSNAQSFGEDWTKRNAIALVNVGYIDSLSADRPVHFGWDGAYDAVTGNLNGVLNLPLTGAAALGSSADNAVAVVTASYKSSYTDAFGDVVVTYDNIERAFAAYEYRLVSIDSPFDQYLASCDGGDCTALSEEQKRGLKLFIGKGLCIECHRGPLLSDGDFHDTGVQQGAGHAFPVDFGEGFTEAFQAGQPKNMHVGTFPGDGAFRTPSLRNVAMTGPYMHGGQLERLDEVINFYNQLWPTDFAGARDTRLAPLGLDDDEAADLEAFLESLTGSSPDPSGGVP